MTLSTQALVEAVIHPPLPLPPLSSVPVCFLKTLIMSYCQQLVQIKAACVSSCACTCMGGSVCLCALVLSVYVSEKESDSEVSVAEAEAVLHLVGVRDFADNKYLEGGERLPERVV